MIRDNSYSRRCAKCEYPRHGEQSATYSLPQLNKKIVYLDQFMISNMVNALASEARKPDDEFYFEAFKKIDRLSKLQLIVCPDSKFHTEESLFSKYPKEHKRVYELLSHGISYWDEWAILKAQIIEHLDRWLNSNSARETSFDAQCFLRGKINAWQPRILLTVNSSWLDNNKTGIKETKDQTFEVMKGVYQKWESNRGLDFNHWYQDELSGWKDTIINSYMDHLRKAAAVLSGADPNYSNAIPPVLAQIFQTVFNTIASRFLNNEERDSKIQEFLEANSLEHVPFVRIYCAVLASVAHRLSVGNMKAEKIKSSFYTDVFISATILPFCDAIFLEKQIASFMKEKPLKNILEKMPLVFSLSNKEDFLSYLDEIELAATKEHLEAVKEVYGENWGAPFCKVLDDEFN